MTTDTSERGLESLICAALTGADCAPAQAGAIGERPADYSPGWLHGDPQDYDREYCVDLAQLSAFLSDTQPDVAPSLDLEQDSPARRRFLARLQGEISKRGTIDVLRKGIKHGPNSMEDAVEQYKRDRNPREKLFEFGRCLAHFAVDDHEVRFCTHLRGKDS